ncbi:MAG: C39 family peptidase [Pseudomonadales bacterium]|jgi:hypothetical protein|nr:C39 family peptidase [Pseudomonadales bacterium]
MKQTIFFAISLALWTAIFIKPTTAQFLPVFSADFHQYVANDANLETYWQITKTGNARADLTNRGLDLMTSQVGDSLIIRPNFDFTNHSQWTMRYDFVFWRIDFSNYEFIIDFQDENNYNAYVIDNSRGNFRHFRRQVTNGQIFDDPSASLHNHFITQTDLNWRQGQTYTIEVNYNNGNIRIVIWAKNNFGEEPIQYNELIYSGYDWFWRPEGTRQIDGPVIKLKQSRPGYQTMSFDNFFIMDHSQDQFLPVTYFSQLDPIWKDDELGNAGRFGKNMTIGSHGCAITSAAMIFHHHGLTHLPNGTDLNPQTLNGWLRDNGGYHAGTLLIWEKLSQLSAEISDAFLWQNLPRLSTSVITDRTTLIRLPGYYNHIIDLLNINEPTITSFGNHFVVDTGFTGRNGGIRMNDPLSPDITTHYGIYQGSHTRHLRRLKPTPAFQNNRIFVIHRGGLVIALHDLSTHRRINDLSIETIQNPTYQQTSFDDLLNGQYILRIDGTNSEPFNIYTFNKRGVLESVFSEATTLNQTSLEIIVNVTDDGITYHARDFSFELHKAIQSLISDQTPQFVRLQYARLLELVREDQEQGFLTRNNYQQFLRYLDEYHQHYLQNNWIDIGRYYNYKQVISNIGEWL